MRRRDFITLLGGAAAAWPLAARAQQAGRVYRIGVLDMSPAASEYRVPSWPATPADRRWREITQDREVPPEWAGREPIFAWEAKVYALA